MLHIAYSLEKNSEHPLAQSVVNYAILKGSASVAVSDFAAIQ